MKHKFFLSVLFLLCVSFSGTVVVLSSKDNFISYGLKPQCLQSARDTLTPISLGYASNFSLTYNGKRVTHKDTAICDSGFQVRCYMTTANSKTNLVIPTSADSIADLFGNAGAELKGDLNKSKGLSLDAKPYLVLVFIRNDTLAVDTLDFKNVSGVRDSSIMTLDIRKEK